MPELKSTFKCGRHRTGFEAEKKVALRLRKMGFRVCAHRLQTPFCELDLLAEKDGRLWLVEVKNQASHWSLNSPVGDRQRSRLQRLFLAVIEVYPQTQLVLAVVSRNSSVDFFFDF